MRLIRNYLALSLSLTLAAPAPALAQLTRIGAAGAVAGRVTAKAPQAEAVGRVLASGKEVYLNDDVTTGPSARLQVLLLDETVFTIGPDSSMVLDEFVYDPFSGKGKVAAKVTKGAFRFVTGKVARNKPEDMRVKLGVGTIGIRGTVVAGRTGDQGSLVVLLGPGAQNNANEPAGKITVGNEGAEVEITRPGFGSNVAPGQPPTPPFQVPQTELDALAGEMAPKAESSSGDEGPASGSSPEQESGQETAAGGESLAGTSSTQEVSTELSNTTQNAAQDKAGKSIADGIARWDDLRAIPSGIAHFDKSGLSITPTLCSGVACSGATAQLSYLVGIDFGARTYAQQLVGPPSCSAGCLSFVSVSMSGGNVSTPGSQSDSISFPSSGFAFGADGVNAVHSFTSTSGKLTGTFTFKNSGGIAGNAMDIQVDFNNANLDKASGAHTGPRFNCLPGGGCD